MGRSITGFDERLARYIVRRSRREPAVAAALRKATATLPMGEMQISPEQGQLLALLAQAIGAKRVVEVGTFTGYSALWIAAALPPRGRMVCCDVSEEWTALGREYWRQAGVAHKIDLRIAPALATLDALLKEGGAGKFDMAFIDADKTNYERYYERCLKLLRPGGLVAIDNVLWGGSVVNPRRQTKDTKALRALNRKLHRDRRIALSILPVGDGMTLALKR
ncbi:MAG: O-methyltransferase [Burkholderiales bacterium]|nr:O-methyltransferase [Burkholderiales bacterium]